MSGWPLELMQLTSHLPRLENDHVKCGLLGVLSPLLFALGPTLTFARTLSSQP